MLTDVEKIYLATQAQTCKGSSSWGGRVAGAVDKAAAATGKIEIATVVSG
jgi:hypothetical protein